MTTAASIVRRRPVLAYYVLTFAISWGGVLLVVGGPAGILGTPGRFEELLPFAIMALLAGPLVAGVLMTALVGGRAGLRDLLSRLLKWRVGARWWAVALVAAPLLMTAIFLVLSLFSDKFLPAIVTAEDKASCLFVGLATGLAAGLFEEPGWTGFAIPALRRRHGVLSTGLVVGFLWAVWHVLPALWLGFSSGTIRDGLSLASYLADPFLFLWGFRVVMVWVYDRTGSLLLAMLMHMGLTAGARIVTPAGIAGAPLLVFGVTWAVVVWAVVAVVRASGGPPLSRRPIETGKGG